MRGREARTQGRRTAMAVAGLAEALRVWISKKAAALGGWAFGGERALQGGEKRDVDPGPEFSRCKDVENGTVGLKQKQWRNGEMAGSDARKKDKYRPDVWVHYRPFASCFCACLPVTD